MSPEAREILRKWLDDGLPEDWLTSADVTGGARFQRVTLQGDVTERIEPEEFYADPS